MITGIYPPATHSSRYIYLILLFNLKNVFMMTAFFFLYKHSYY